MTIRNAIPSSFYPGDEFASYAWGGPHFGELSPTATAAGALTMRRKPHTPVEIDVPTLEGAIRADLSVEYWGGHIGTGEQSFSVNDGPWTALPQPEGTPEPPQVYYRTLLGNPSVEVPLTLLREGSNQIRFHAGSQIRYDFGWGFFWIYACTLRVYYRPTGESPRGEVSMTTRAGDDGTAEVRRVVYRQDAGDEGEVSLIGTYLDYDWEGNGRLYDRHYHFRHARLRGAIGVGRGRDVAIDWDTTWVPDQTGPIDVLPLVTDADGRTRVGEVVPVVFDRTERSVRMILASDVPPNFGVRMGESMIVRFRDCPAGETVKRAVVALSTWSAAHADEIGLNGVRIVERVGEVHDVSHDLVAVPEGLLVKGTNIFYVFSRTEHHAAEMNWPGPALLVETERAEG